jgi:large subunit ribosomal protein L10
MPTEKSIAEVEALKTLFSGSTVLISTGYRGLDVGTMSEMRRALHGGGAGYRIAKNTLARIAADEIGQPEIKDLIDGPCGFAHAEGDASVVAKALMKFLTDGRLDLEIHGALLDGKLIDRNGVEALSKLPGREQLLGMLFGQMNAPVASFARVLAGPARGLAVVLQRHIENLETGDGGDAEPVAEPAEA